MRDKHVYAIYDGDVEVFKGTETEIAEHLGLSPNSRMGYYLKSGAKLLKKYRVEKVHEGITPYVYDFYEDGKLVFTGTSEEFKAKYNVDVKSVSSYANGKSKIKNRWLPVCRTEKPKAEDNKLNGIIEDLKINGDRYVKKEPVKIIEQLKALGMNCTYRKATTMKGFVIRLS